MPGQNKDTQLYWLIECEPKPKEITCFVADGQLQARALSDLDEPLADYYWLWNDTSDQCYLYIKRPPEKGLNRKYFLKTHKGFNELERNGT